MSQYPYYLAIDLEATCWLAGDLHAGQNEIIEVGLAIVDSEKRVVFNDGWFVRPTLNQKLSEFCKELTSITQDDVDQAGTFTEVMPLIEKKITEVTSLPVKSSLFLSWGNYDFNQFLRDCKLHKYRYPFGEHVNFKKLFLKKYGKEYGGFANAVKFLGLEFEGRCHRGKDDALNLARIMIVTDLLNIAPPIKFATLKMLQT